MPAAVLAIVKITPNDPTHARFRAKVSSRRSEAAGLVPGSDAQFSQKPCSPLMGKPQLGQSGSVASPTSLSADWPLRSTFQRSIKWCAALFIAGEYRQWVTSPRPSTSSNDEAPPFSFACKVSSGERCHSLRTA